MASEGGFWAAAEFRADVPRAFRLASLDVFEAIGGDAAVLAEIRAWLYGPEGRWLYLWGPNGVGKTSLSVALGALLALEGREVHFVTAVGALGRSRQLLGEGGNLSADYWQALREVDLLILDELGAQHDTEFTLERLFELIGERHDEERQTVVTSNLDLVELGTQVSKRTSWRIAELADVIEVRGKNLRAVGAAA